MNETAAIITACGSVMAGLLGVYLTYIITRIKLDLEASDKKVDRVSVRAAKTKAIVEDIKEDTTETLKVSNTIHTLVNNQMHLALKAIVDLTEEKARRTGKPEDRAAADEAKERLANHDAKQSIVDKMQ